jgi:thioredoxin-like negative regulator of GroEL
MYASVLTRIAICCILVQSEGLGWLKTQDCQGSEPVLQAESETDESDIKKVYREVFLKDCVMTFSATWCVPCRTQHAENKLLSKKIRLWEIDIDQHPGLWQYITTTTMIPFTCIIKKGKVVKQWSGVVDHKTVEDAFNKK